MSQLQDRIQDCMHLHSMCSAFADTKMMSRRPKMQKFWRRAEQSFVGSRVSVVTLLKEFAPEDVEALLQQAYEVLRESKYYARVPDETRLWLMSKSWYHGAWYEDQLDIDKIAAKEYEQIKKAREEMYSEERAARRRTRE